MARSRQLWSCILFLAVYRGQIWAQLESPPVLIPEAASRVQGTVVDAATGMPLADAYFSGLPRSGSTLLAAILRQNPRFHSAISGPMSEVFVSLLRTMSGASETSIFISDTQRQRILQSVMEDYYADISQPEVIFDTSRGWCSMLPAVARLFPESRMICTLRSPAWILDSIERHVQSNAFIPSRLFNHDASGSVYTRVEMLTKLGVVGSAVNGLRQAWFGEDADRIIALRYKSLTEDPAKTIRKLYDSLGEPAFEHDFKHVEYDEPEFDAYLGLPGFHNVSGRKRLNSRKTILPPEVFDYHDHSFWDMPGQNPRGVIVL